MALDAAKARVRLYFERLLNQKDLSVCDEMLAPDFIDHDAPPDTPPGSASTKTFVAQMLAEYPDLHLEVETVIAEGDEVALAAIWHGTHSVWDAPLHRRGMVIVRLNAAGQLVERWSSYKDL